MKSVKHVILCAGASFAVATVMLTKAAPAEAQQVGDVKCQDDGYIYSWNSILGMWTNTFRKCEANTSRSSRSRYEDDEDEDDDRSERRSSRRNNNSNSNSNNNNNESSGELVTGDQKCSPDGYVMTYYAALKRWSKSSFSRC